MIEGEEEAMQSQNRPPKKTKNPDDPSPAARIFEDATLNGLSTQDKQLIRVLSYQDKNVARMLQ